LENVGLPYGHPFSSVLVRGEYERVLRDVKQVDWPAPVRGIQPTAAWWRALNLKRWARSLGEPRSSDMCMHSSDRLA
jgi:hypothetical protein